MSLEIEKKYRLSPELANELRSRLGNVEARYIDKRFETNTIYGGGSLDLQGAILRIRVFGDKAALTFKRRVANDSDVKHQVEYESEFSDPPALAKILASLGYIPRLIYEKRRETWLFGGTEIVIDELPFGWFMEVEGDLDDIRIAEGRLGLEQLETVHETYPQLTFRLGSVANGIYEARF